jgi:hypothetical protein
MTKGIFLDITTSFGQFIIENGKNKIEKKKFFFFFVSIKFDMKKHIKNKKLIRKIFFFFIKFFEINNFFIKKKETNF